MRADCLDLSGSIPLFLQQSSSIASAVRKVRLLADGFSIQMSRHRLDDAAADMRVTLYSSSYMEAQLTSLHGQPMAVAYSRDFDKFEREFVRKIANWPGAMPTMLARTTAGYEFKALASIEMVRLVRHHTSDENGRFLSTF